MRTLVGRVFLIFSTAILLASCGTGQSTEVTGAPLRVAYSSKWGDYTMIVANKAGFFDKHGVEIEPVYYPISYNSVADLAAQGIDGALMPIGDAVNVANRTALKVVAVSDDGRGNSIIASPEIATLPDLKGKRIGLQLGTWHELIVSDMLASAGLSESDVILSNLHPESVPEALGTQVDAAYTWEPYAGAALAEDNRILFHSEQFAGYSPDVIAFQQSVVEQRKEEVRLFLTAWFEAVDFRQENPDEAARIIAAYFGISQDELASDPRVRILTRIENYSYFQGATSVGQPSLAVVTEANAEYLLRIGVLTKKPDLEQLLDPSYLQ